MQRRVRLTALMAQAIFAGLGVAAAADPHTLTTARAIRRMLPEEAAVGHPVRVRGVVTYYDSGIGSAFTGLLVEDSSGTSVYVKPRTLPTAPLHGGTLVEVVGVTDSGKYAPIIDQGEVKLIGESKLPTETRRVTMGRMLTGAEDGNWVTIEGIVHSVWEENNDERIAVEMSDGLLVATAVKEPGADYERLIDAKVRIRGTSVPFFNNNRQLTGAYLVFPGLKELTVLEAGPPDAFALPSELIGSILSYNPDAGSGHRIHTRGRVTLYWPGRLLCLTERSHGLCVDSAQTTPLEVGEDVEVVGFPMLGNLAPTLNDALFRAAGEGGALDKTPVVSAEAALGGWHNSQHNSQLVEIEGQLIGQDRAAKDPTIILSAGNFVFSAVLPAGSPAAAIEALREGSTLRVTGICSVSTEDVRAIDQDGYAVPSSFSILLRTAGDVKVLHRPSWWTPGHALTVFGIVAVVVLAAFFWIVMLHRQVERQTQEICNGQERLRHMAQHDTLTDLPNRALLYDRMEMELARAERSESVLGLLMVDLDRFKEINDTLGHGVGDAVLREVAMRLIFAVRKTDTVARIGGDEFVILLPELNTPGEIELIAAKIVAAFTTPFKVGTRKVPISGSVGGCTYPNGGTGTEILLQSVDAAMYRAKAQGRNCYYVTKEQREPTAMSR